MIKRHRVTYLPLEDNERNTREPSFLLPKEKEKNRETIILAFELICGDLVKEQNRMAMRVHAAAQASETKTYGLLPHSRQSTLTETQNQPFQDAGILDGNR